MRTPNHPKRPPPTPAPKAPKAPEAPKSGPNPPSAEPPDAPTPPREINTIHDTIANALGDPQALLAIKARQGQTYDDHVQELNSAVRDVSTVYADAVRLLFKNGERAQVEVIEVQRRIDLKKPNAWKKYWMGCHTREDLPVHLLILCTTNEVATWAREVLENLPIKDPGTVYGPNEIREHFPDGEAFLLILDALEYEQVRRTPNPDPAPYLNALTQAMKSPVWRALAHAIMTALFNLREMKEYEMNEQLKERMIQNIHALAPEEFERYEAKGRAEGEAKGMQNAVMLTLTQRGIVVSSELRERLQAADLDTLTAWFGRLLAGDPVEQIFALPS